MSPSIWQILIVAAIVILLFGPKRIPGLGKSLGEAIRGFKKGLNDDERDVTHSVKTQSIPDSQPSQPSQSSQKEPESSEANKS